MYSSTLIKMAWSLEQDLTRQRAKRRAEEEEKEEFRLRLEQIGNGLTNEKRFFTFFLVEYVFDGSKVCDGSKEFAKERIN